MTNIVRATLEAGISRAWKWTIPAAILIAAGFACDGITETGHHLFLILGGIAIGFGYKAES